MSCAFCLEPLNDGATVCKTCGRKQPASEKTIRQRIIIGLVVLAGFSATGLLLFSKWNNDERVLALDHAKLAAGFCGAPGVTDAFAEQMVKKFHDEGASWRDAEKQFLTLIKCDFSNQ